MHRLCGVTWAGAINIRHAAFFPHSWELHGPAGSFCSSFSALVLSTHSLIGRGLSLYMDTFILAIVSYQPKHPSIVGAAFEPLLDTDLLCVLQIPREDVPYSVLNVVEPLAPWQLPMSLCYWLFGYLCVYVVLDISSSPPLAPATITHHASYCGPIFSPHVTYCGGCCS